MSGGSLAPIARLLGTPAGATIAWAHFLAFDLLVGRWAYLDSREQGLSAWAMAPVLLLTFMLGPLGFLAYLAVRAGAGTLARARAALVSLSRAARPSRGTAILVMRACCHLAARQPDGGLYAAATPNNDCTAVMPSPREVTRRTTVSSSRATCHSAKAQHSDSSRARS